MRTFGIRSKVLVLAGILSLTFITNISAQYDCDSDFLTDCGDIIASFKIGGTQTEVCEGYAFEVINNSTIDNVSYYIWDWGDGTRDSVTTTSNIKHTYNIPADKVCTKKKSTFYICLIAVKKCGVNMVSVHNNRSPISIVHKPRANFNFSNSVCIERNVDFTSIPCNEDSYLWTFPDGTTNSSKNSSFTFKTPGVYSINLKYTNGCGSDDTTKSITVVDNPDAVVKLSPSAQDSVVCVGDRVTLINRSNQWSNTKWIFPANTVLNDTARWKIVNIAKVVKGLNNNNRQRRLDSLALLDTIVFDVLQPGTYKFEMLSTNACGQKKWTWNLKVVQAPNVSLQDPPNFCETAELMPMLQTNSGDVTKYVWSFPGGIPSSFEGQNPPKIKYNTPGTYTYSLQVIAPCDTIPLSKSFTIFSKAPISFIDVPTKYCKSSSLDTLKASPAGGKWSGIGIVDEDLGIFDPAIGNVGIRTITYTFGPIECQSIGTIDIEVVNASTVTTMNEILCINSPVTQLKATPASGTWSGNFAVDPSGKFDPAKSGVGVFNVDYQYNDPNGCVVNKKVEVNVEDFPTLNGQDTIIACREGGIQALMSLFGIVPSPEGGSFAYFINNTSIPAQIDPANYIVDTLTIRYEYTRNKCVVSDSAKLIFIDRPNIVITKDTVLCIDKPTFQLSTNTPGGIWSGQGVNPTTGLVTIVNAQIGENMFTYTHSPNTTCEQSLSVKVTIKDPGSTITLGGDVSICDTGLSTYQLTEFSPSNGIWSGPNIATSGLINVTLLKRDTAYNYTYKITDQQASDCSASKSIAFRVNSLPRPDFSIAGTPCIGQQITLTADTTVQLETLRFTTSDGVQSSVSPFSHVFNAKGSYSISLQVTDKNNCSNYITKSYYVTTKPIPSFTLASDEGCAAFTVLTTNTSVGDSMIFIWNINNQTFGTTDLPTIQLDNITQDTQFIIQLTATNLCGPMTFLDTVLVHPYPRVNFGISDLEGCSPLEVSFANTTLGNADTWLWDLGNGVISTDSLPSNQAYTTPKDSVSTYKVTCIATNECGVDTLTKTITVYPPDVTAFIEKSVLDLCQFDTLSLESFSTPGAILTWKAILPNGTAQGAQGKVARFALDTFGVYTFVLYANRCGTDTDTVKYTIKPAPKLDFEEPDFLCQYVEHPFKVLGNELSEVVWDFGDGTIISGHNIAHAYQQAGTFTIKVTGRSTVNNCPRSISKIIQIIGAPTSSFIPSTLSGCEPLTVYFDNKSVGAVKYDWDFGDTTSNSNDNNPTHIFKSPGIFKTTLVVYDTYGCFADTNVVNIQVFPKPKSDFDFLQDTICRLDTIFTIDNSSNAAAHTWRILNDTFNTPNIKFIPQLAGAYNVTLITTTNLGCKDTLTKSFFSKTIPEASFEVVPPMGCQPLSIDIINQSEFSEFYKWTIINKSTNQNYFTSGDKNVEIVISDAGNFNLLLEAITSNGCPSDTQVRDIVVYPKPVANIMALKDSLCGAPMSVKLSASTADDHSWHIEGVEVSKFQMDTIAFDEPGQYRLTYFVTNTFLCKDTAENVIDIYLEPIADFEIDDMLCERQEINAENLSINANEYAWLINGVESFTSENPMLVFEESGIYKIQLVAKYNSLCQDTSDASFKITVHDTPTTDFSYIADYDGNAIGEVSFTNLSTDQNQSWWDLGDGSTSNEKDPIHEYDINRAINVKLVVANINDGIHTCLDSIIKPIAPEWITTFYAPNALSPESGDALVKVFKPVGIGLKTYKISIFSPWGQEVWTSTALKDSSPLEYWDGTFNGELVPQGAYSWIAEITFVNGKSIIKKGSVTVVR